MPGYSVMEPAGPGGRVVLPPGADDDVLVDVSVWDEDNLRAFAARRRPPRSRRTLETTAVLVHHAHNEYNPNAISVSAPASEGGSLAQRHLGYMLDRYLWRIGPANLPLLIAYAGGEVECSIVIHGRDTLLIDIPELPVLGEAIAAFLAGRGITAPGPPRSPDAEPEHRTHTGPTPDTTRTLAHLASFTSPHVAPTGVRIATSSHHLPERRTLDVHDPGTGRRLGTITNRILFLLDDRDRDTVLTHLKDLGVPVQWPVTEPRLDPQVLGDDTWSEDRVPNVRFRQRAGSLDLRVHDPADPNSQESFAIYNPATNIVWVEDSRLVAPAVVALHRHGIDVVDVGLPRRAWGLESEIPFRALRDRSASRDVRPAEDIKLRLRRGSRRLVGAGILTDTHVTWLPDDRKAEQPTDTKAFKLHERFVSERCTLFPEHKLTSSVTGCRLCTNPALAFTTPVATSELAYCHSCLTAAVQGVVETRQRAAKALRELAEVEFDGQPMLAAQLETLHVNPYMPVPAETIDRLLLLRFGIARKRVAWTLLLEAAGFAENGLRTGRGTLVRSRDGHLCLSLREKAVCDFLHQHGIAHDREPLYPSDPDYNPNGLRRADWLLGDGTLVELWGLPKDPVYAAKMVQKRQLADRHGLSLVELIDADLPNLSAIFAPWMPPGPRPAWTWSPLLISAPVTPAEPAPARGDDRGRNDYNATIQAERVVRCAEAVRLQIQGLTRQQIGEKLGAGAEAVKTMLRDGKFYADPTTDPQRADLARRAGQARDQRITRAEFAAETKLTAPKAAEAWRDAAVLHESPSET